jgi:hypothetical protein
MNSILNLKENFTATAIMIAVSLLIGSCQKNLKIGYDNASIKQVIIANLTPESNLFVNISRSKGPNDYNPVEFLSNCRVDLYEDSIYKETLPFVLRDTLSGLGYYVSTSLLRAGKTYRIVSTHPALGVAEATEYLPYPPRVVNCTLLQHADSLHTTMKGIYTVTLQDSANFKNYYYISTFYRIQRPVVTDSDTAYVNDHLFNIPSYTPEIPNPSDFNRLFFTDERFDGQMKTFTIEFPSIYNEVYREIRLNMEVSATGKNFYDWFVQQIPIGQDFLNEGMEERSNLPSNIVNGYGHFTANSSYYTTVRIK